MNDSCQFPIINAANNTTQLLYLLHMFEKSNIPYGKSWKSRTMSWRRKREDILP
jgi:hypothetical protein